MSCKYPSDARELPPRQQQVLDFIRAEIEAGRPFPSQRAIAEHMGWKNPGSALDCLYLLRWRGKLEQIHLCRSSEVKGHARRYQWRLVA